MTQADITNMVWVEKYRPKTIEECILPAHLKKTFDEIVAGGKMLNLLLAGTAGTGKTTVAKALCNELGLDWIIINGSEESGIDVLRNKIRQFASAISLDGGEKPKVVILDEADYLNCLHEEESIVLVDGKTIKLKEMVDGVKYEVISLNPKTGLFENDIAEVSGRQESEVFEVELESGEKIRVTEDHPFMVRLPDGSIGTRTIKEGLDGYEIILR